jgi:hypothetical protein
MKVDFWLGKAAKRASQPTITLASIRKANFQFSIFISRSFACLARAKIKIVYSAEMGAKWTNSTSTTLFGNQSLLMRKISLAVFQNERLWQNYSLCLIRFV